MWRCRIIVFLVSLSLFTPMMAQDLSSEASISLITCTPGEALYNRFGHTALRIYDPKNELDVTFNYGIFDFNTDHFYWKFVRGETWYELGAAPTWWFMREYREAHRSVYEQRLNLLHDERDSLWAMLQTNYLPQNRKYLYNFVFDNCATRPYKLICRVIGDTLQSGYRGCEGLSFRAIIRHYTGPHSWANAGINLLFGSRADRTMTAEESLFLPEQLMLFIAEAYEADGTRLASLPSDAKPFVVPRTPWYASWEFGLAIYFLCVLAVSFYDRKRGRWSWGAELAAGIPFGLLLLIVAFLTFFSCHPLVGFGWRLLIIPFTHLCARIPYILR